MKVYNLDHKVPSFYGEENFTFREGIENGRIKVFRECNLDSMFKPRYYASWGFFKARVNGNQAKKYVKEARRIKRSVGITAPTLKTTN